MVRNILQANDNKIEIDGKKYSLFPDDSKLKELKNKYSATDAVIKILTEPPDKYKLSPTITQTYDKIRTTIDNAKEVADFAKNMSTAVSEKKLPDDNLDLKTVQWKGSGKTEGEKTVIETDSTKLSVVGEVHGSGEVSTSKVTVKVQGGVGASVGLSVEAKKTGTKVTVMAGADINVQAALKGIETVNNVINDANALNKKFQELKSLSENVKTQVENIAKKLAGGSFNPADVKKLMDTLKVTFTKLDDLRKEVKTLAQHLTKEVEANAQVKAEVFALLKIDQSLYKDGNWSVDASASVKVGVPISNPFKDKINNSLPAFMNNAKIFDTLTTDIKANIGIKQAALDNLGNSINNIVTTIDNFVKLPPLSMPGAAPGAINTIKTNAVNIGTTLGQMGQDFAKVQVTDATGPSISAGPASVRAAYVDGKGKFETGVLVSADNLLGYQKGKVTTLTPPNIATGSFAPVTGQQSANVFGTFNPTVLSGSYYLMLNKDSSFSTEALVSGSHNFAYGTTDASLFLKQGFGILDATYKGNFTGIGSPYASSQHQFMLGSRYIDGHIDINDKGQVTDAGGTVKVFGAQIGSEAIGINSSPKMMSWASIPLPKDIHIQAQFLNDTQGNYAGLFVIGTGQAAPMPVGMGGP